MGGEFTNKTVSKYLEEQNATLHILGGIKTTSAYLLWLKWSWNTLGESKASCVERAQKTFQNLMYAHFFNNAHTKFDFFKQIKNITELYNKKINLNDNMSPIQRIHSTKLPKYAHLFNVDLELENKKIKKLRGQLLKKYKIGSRVRLLTTKKLLVKDAISQKYTADFFYIYKIKDPILSKWPFRFRIKNSNNQELAGLFLKNELKLVWKNIPLVLVKPLFSITFIY